VEKAPQRTTERESAAMPTVATDLRYPSTSANHSRTKRMSRCVYEVAAAISGCTTVDEAVACQS
jgi:hypothetical protein